MMSWPSSGPVVADGFIETLNLSLSKAIGDACKVKR